MFVRSLPLLCLCFLSAQALYRVPLRGFSGKLSSTLLSTSQKNQSASGNVLSFALDPAKLISFLNMVDNLEGDAGRGYYLQMAIGTPGQTLNILVDTGSSNFAVASAPHPYISTYFNRELSRTYRTSGESVSVRYTQGDWQGELGSDLITIPHGPNGSIVTNIAAILTTNGFFLPGIKWQGILGLAFSSLAQPDSSVAPFFDSLVKQTGIPDVFSLQMCGEGFSSSIANEPADGSLIMGGLEPTLYHGSMWYTPILEEWYYQVEVLKLEVGEKNLNMDCREYNKDKAIVDSGTTLLRLPLKVFDSVVEAITQMSIIQVSSSSGFFSGSKLACWVKDESPWGFFPKISIYLRAANTSQSFRLTILPQLYIHLIRDIDSTLNCFRFGVSPSTNGLIIGATVMEGFYVAFDRTNKQVGFAVSTCAESNGVPVAEIAGPFSADGVASGCAEQGHQLQEPLMWLIAYILMVLCALVLLIILALTLAPCKRQRRHAGEVTDESSLVHNRIK